MLPATIERSTDSNHICALAGTSSFSSLPDDGASRLRPSFSTPRKANCVPLLGVTEGCIPSIRPLTSDTVIFVGQYAVRREGELAASIFCSFTNMPRMLGLVDHLAMASALSGHRVKLTPVPTRYMRGKTAVVCKMTMNVTNTGFKIQRQLFARSERVKGIDFHPVEPWILTTLYSGMLEYTRTDHRKFEGAAKTILSQVMSTYGHTRHRYIPLVRELSATLVTNLS